MTKTKVDLVRSSAAEYLTFVAATGSGDESIELRYLERIVSLYLDYAELQAERKIPMSMEDWAQRLDGFLEFNGNELLIGAGKISAEKAKLHAESGFEQFRIIQDRLYSSDFDKFLEKVSEVENE